MSSVEFTWNNRVIRFVDPCGDVCYFFAEVTYDENGKPDEYAQEMCVVGDEIEKIIMLNEFMKTSRLLQTTELHLVLERLRTALTLPILEAKDFPEKHFIYNYRTGSLGPGQQ